MQSNATNRIFILILAVMLGLFSAQAQTVKELEQQRKQTLKNLETTKKLLNETKKSQKSSITKLKLS